MKISAGDDVAAVGKHEWIISRGPRLDRQNLFAMSENVAHCSVHLRYAANAVGVLDARIVFAMRLSNFAILQERVQMRGDSFLSLMRPRFLQTRLKSGRRVAQTI